MNMFRSVLVGLTAITLTLTPRLGAIRDVRGRSAGVIKGGC